MDDNSGGGGGDDDNDDDAIPDLVKSSRIGWYWKYYDDTLFQRYNKAEENLEMLKRLGATVFLEVDATKLLHHIDLQMLKFDRIIFNFPHTGFSGGESSEQVITRNKELVKGFFENASHMLRQSGEVHVSHKLGFPYNMWKLEELALQSSLVQIGSVPFNIEDYPLYNNKRGDGRRADEPFELGKCKTFMFRRAEEKKIVPIPSDIRVASAEASGRVNHRIQFGIGRASSYKYGCLKRMIIYAPLPQMTPLF